MLLPLLYISTHLQFLQGCSSEVCLPQAPEKWWWKNVLNHHPSTPLTSLMLLNHSHSSVSAEHVRHQVGVKTLLRCSPDSRALSSPAFFFFYFFSPKLSMDPAEHCQNACASGLHAERALHPCMRSFTSSPASPAPHLYVTTRRQVQAGSLQQFMRISDICYC